MVDFYEERLFVVVVGEGIGFWVFAEIVKS